MAVMRFGASEPVRLSEPFLFFFGLFFFFHLHPFSFMAHHDFDISDFGCANTFLFSFIFLISFNLYCFLALWI